MFYGLIHALLTMAIILTGLIGMLALVVAVEQRAIHPASANGPNRRPARPVAHQTP